MLFVESKLTVADNSGAKVVKCIKVFSSKKKVNLGQVILVVINKKLANKTNIVKKKIYYGLIVSLKYPKFRQDGQYISFSKNSIVLLSNKFKLIGSRIIQVVSKELSIKFEDLKKKAKLII